MFSRTTTYVIEGVAARRVTIEVDIRPGLPAFSVVGLPDVAVRETRERVRAALLNEGYDFPQRRVTVNLVPGDLGRTIPGLDLPIAAAILSASGQLPADAFTDAALIGELSLDGGVQPVRGTIVIAEAAAREGLTKVIVPRANSGEAALVAKEITVPVRRLADLAAIARGELGEPLATEEPPEPIDGPDLRDLRGHEISQRALEIAAAGGHHLLLTGSPGCGKTMLARRLPSILPSMSDSEALEVTHLQSIAGNLRVDGLATARPFRAPHHTISASGLTGGGTTPMPGEVTLATNGVLFLDELAEFSTRTLEALRRPLEDGVVAVTRSQRTHVFPARFMLIAATNPCPCGAFDNHRCRCSETEITRYQRRLSGPLLDRFDMHCRVERPTAAEVEAGPVATSAEVLRRVESARQRQAVRLQNEAFHCNGQLDGSLARKLIKPAESAQQLLNDAYCNHTLSLRGYDRCLRVARTIADLDGRDDVSTDDVAEALSLRGLEVAA